MYIIYINENLYKLKINIFVSFNWIFYACDLPFILYKFYFTFVLTPILMYQYVASCTLHGRNKESLWLPVLHKPFVKVMMTTTVHTATLQFEVRCQWYKELSISLLAWCGIRTSGGNQTDNYRAIIYLTIAMQQSNWVLSCLIVGNHIIRKTYFFIFLYMIRERTFSVHIF